MTVVRTEYECDQCHKLASVHGDELPDGWVIQEVSTPESYIAGVTYGFHVCSTECQEALLERLGIKHGSHRNTD